MKQLLIIPLLLTVILVQAQTYNYFNAYTPKSTAVQAMSLTGGDLSSGQKATAKSDALATYPGITFLADATWSYNCHGWAWNMSEGGATGWINEYDNSSNQNVYKYWNDGSYVQVCNEADADKIHYYAGDHSAVKSTVSGQYESKWGANIRARHAPTNAPVIYNTSYRNYYASTKITGDVSSSLCSGTRVFSVKNITGATYSWTTSASASISGSSTGYSVTVQRNGSSNGAAWAEVTITGCGSTATRRVNFNVGALPPATVTILGIAPYGALDASCTVTGPGATSYKWYVDGILKKTGYSSSEQYIPAGNCGATHILTVGVVNACGESAQYSTPESVFWWNCHRMAATELSMYPNPSTGNFVINGSDDAVKKGGSVKVVIYDRGNVIRKQYQLPRSRQYNISAGDLPPDVYIVQLVDGEQISTQKLVIRK